MDARRLWFALFVLAVFGLGLATGVLVDRQAGWPPRRPFAPRPAAEPGLGPAPLGPRLLVGRLAADLKLNDDQRARIERILLDSRDRIERLYADVRGRFAGEQRDLREAIRQVLTPDQQKRFDEWLRENPLGPPRGAGPPAAGPRGRRGSPPGPPGGR